MMTMMHLVERVFPVTLKVTARMLSRSQTSVRTVRSNSLHHLKKPYHVQQMI